MNIAALNISPECDCEMMSCLILTLISCITVRSMLGLQSSVVMGKTVRMVFRVSLLYLLVGGTSAYNILFFHNAGTR